MGEGKIAQFDSDFAIAQSWQRLMSGNYEPVDLTLLRHEMLEYKLVKSGMTQNEAHIIASSTYNYTAETEEYYASLKKH